MSTAADPLEPYRLKSLEQGQYTGCALLVNLLQDALLLQHTGVGCKHKGVSQLATHDAGRTLPWRTGWTEIGDRELITGASIRLGPYGRTWIARQRPRLVVTLSVTFLDLSGEDVVEEVKRLDLQHPDTHVVYAKVPGHTGDLFSGWTTTLLTIVQRFDWSQPADRADEVGLLGYFYDRIELDHAANVDVVGRLLGGLGLRLGPVVPSPGRFDDWAALPRAGTLVALPHLRPALPKLQGLTKRPLAVAPLPMGQRGTAAFLRAVGAAAGVPAATVEAAVRTGWDTVERSLAVARERLRDVRVAVIAEAPSAAGWMALLEELGVQVVLVGLKGRTLGGREALEAELEAVGARLPAGATVLEDPSLVAVRDAVRGLWKQRRLDGVLGSATDFNVLGTLPLSDFVGPWTGGVPVAPGLFRLEIGFPYKEYHCTMGMPFLGWEGMLVVAQRLLTAPRTWDSGRALRF